MFVLFVAITLCSLRKVFFGARPMWAASSDKMRKQAAQQATQPRKNKDLFMDILVSLASGDNPDILSYVEPRSLSLRPYDSPYSN